MAIISGVHHIALNVSDFDKSIKFYTEGLGMKVYRSWGGPERRIAMVDIGRGSCMEIFSCKEPRTMVDKEAGNFIHLAFRVDDAKAAFDRAIACGAEPLVEPKHAQIQSDPVMNVSLAFVKGPDGEELEFFHPED